MLNIPRLYQTIAIVTFLIPLSFFSQIVPEAPPQPPTVVCKNGSSVRICTYSTHTLHIAYFLHAQKIILNFAKNGTPGNVDDDGGNPPPVMAMAIIIRARPLIQIQSSFFRN